MKIDKSELAGKLAKLKAAIPGKGAFAGVEGVLIKENQATAYNLKIGIKTTLSVSSDDAPFILCSKAIEMINNLPDGEIEITPDKNSINIVTSTIKNKFPLLDPSGFVEPNPLSDDGESLKISSKKLSEMASSVLYAAATNEAKPVYTGILFEASDGELNVVAVDGYRLAWNKAEFEGDFKFIVPRSAMDKLLKIGMSGDIDISYHGNNAVFASEEYTVYVRLLTGGFLDYKKTVPKHEKEIVVSRKALLESIGRILICSDDKLKPPAVLTFNAGKMVLSTNTSTAIYSEEIEIHGAPDEKLRMGFNPVYMRDNIKAYDAEFVTMSFGNALAPIIMSDDMLITLCLPVRLKDNA